MRHVFVSLSLATALLAAAPAVAQQHVRPAPGPEGSWRLIGRTSASYVIDHDTIVVQGPFDQFRRLQFRVSDAPLQLHRVVVHFGNGTQQELQVRENIREGGQTRAIDLNGGERHVKRIDFWYDTKGLGKGKADVSVFGLK